MSTPRVLAAPPRLGAACARAVRRVGRRFQLDRHLDFWMQEIDETWSLRQIRARVVDVIDETHDVKTFVLAPNARWSTPHRAGQFVNLEIEIDGVRTSRCYSLSSAPGDRHLAITVKRVSGGRVSPWLHRTLRAGAVVGLSRPMGEFVLEGQPGKLLLLSGGSGITPVMSILRDLARRDAVDDVVFVHAARSSRDLIFARELTLLALHHPGLRIQLWDDERRGRLDVGALASLVPDLAERQTMLCGPPPMMEAIGAHWHALGIGERLKTERFAPARPQLAKTSGSRPVRLKLAGSDRTIETGGASLLEELEGAGLRPAYGCRMGICNTCVCRKAEGVVENIVTGALSDQPDEEIRLCVSRARTDVTLALNSENDHDH